MCIRDSRCPGASGGVGPDGAGLLVSSEALALTPGQLAAWLWGYRTLEELEPDSGIPYLSLIHISSLTQLPAPIFPPSELLCKFSFLIFIAYAILGNKSPVVS